MNKDYKTLIVTGGYVNPSLLSEYLSENNREDFYVIGVDKGLETLDALRILPDLCLGDFDSANASIRAKYSNSPDAICLQVEKDYTDTHVAVLEAIKRNTKEIVIFGATGTRIDHMMGNLGLLKICLDQGIKAMIVDEHNRIQMIKSQMTLYKNSQYGKYVSLIPFSDQVIGITLCGFKYDVTNLTMIKQNTIGISNELREEEGHIKISEGYLLVFETDD